MGTTTSLRGAPKPLTQTITTTGAGTLDILPLLAAGYTMCRARLKAGGCGGGSGRQGAAGTVRCAGGPGANGAYTDVLISLASMLAVFPTGQIPYVVGPGTAGGVAQASADSNGNSGTSGVTNTNSTYLGTNSPGLLFARARVSGPGQGGTATTGTAGSPVAGTAPNNTPASAQPTGTAGSQNQFGMAGPGGGITVGNVAGGGGAGQDSVFGGGTAGTGGVVGGAAPTSGANAPIFGVDSGGAPGGGAASIVGAAQAGANAPANSGSGGGGGGASLNGSSSGAGGDGGSGYAVLTFS